MITREEVISGLWNNKSVSTLGKVYYDSLIKRIFDQQDQLQQHIKSLEAQLTNKPNCCVFHDRHKNDCNSCDWNEECHYHIFYNPKDTQ